VGPPSARSTRPSATARERAAPVGSAPGFPVLKRVASIGLPTRSFSARCGRSASLRPGVATASRTTQSGSGSAPTRARWSWTRDRHDPSRRLACPSMASWSDVEAEAPELAARARQIFDARRHKTLATLRPDGSPRTSGTEVQFVDGEMWFGSMWKSVKALDLQRDPPFALHSGSGDPPEWTADAKVRAGWKRPRMPSARRPSSAAMLSPSKLISFGQTSRSSSLRASASHRTTPSSSRGTRDGA
jgi:pyridoxamine 5'-phosphate oxidase-like protein